MKKELPFYGPERFTYQPESNSYRCPAGQQLNYGWLQQLSEVRTASFSAATVSPARVAARAAYILRVLRLGNPNVFLLLSCANPKIEKKPPSVRLHGILSDGQRLHWCELYNARPYLLAPQRYF